MKVIIKGPYMSECRFWEVKPTRLDMEMYCTDDLDKTNLPFGVNTQVLLPITNALLLNFNM